MSDSKEAKKEAKQSLLRCSPSGSDTSNPETPSQGWTEWWYSGTRNNQGEAAKPSLTKVVFACCAATLCNVAFGYDVGVLSGSLADMSTSLDLSTVEKEAATSGLNFVAAFGALVISGNILDRFGRKVTIMCSSMLLLGGAAAVSFAHSFPVLLLGRALQGFGSGCSWCACSVYITELAPTRLRGTLVALADISINLGILLGYGIDFTVYKATGNDHDLRWRLSMGLSVIFPGLFILAYPFIPETPRWLASKGRYAEALTVLQSFTSEPDSTPAEMLTDLKDSIEEEQKQTSSWGDLLCSTNATTRRTIAIAITLGMAQQATGTEAILYYTPTVLADTYHLDADHMLYANLGVGGCKLFGELVAAYLVERTGRRLLVIGGNLLLSLCIFGIALSFHLGGSATVTILCLCLVMLTFSIGPGPFTFVVVNEMVPLKLRGKAVASSVFMNRITSGTVAFTFLSLKTSLAGRGGDSEGAANAFFLYGALGLGCTIFYALFLPDTTGQSLEDIQHNAHEKDNSSKTSSKA
eukprot:m.181717 g.181717  ORF g.181717 m.181717 type:complete len:525 (-) comp32079_c0_seq1:40-1614(-)